MATSRLRPSHRIRVENEMIRKRDKQQKYDQLWQQTTKYFDDFNKKNQKYEEWTSPRYYETNTKLIKEIDEKRKKDEQLIKRRNELEKLLQQDQQSYQIELMMKKTKENTPRNDDDDDDDKLEILKDLNRNLKIDENARKRHEAELKLYHQWRNNHPVLHEYERYRQMNDIKLSWLDQQIEKRIEHDKEEEECRRLLQQHEQQIKQEQDEFEKNKQQLQQKQQELIEFLQKQIDELHEKNRINDELKMKEDETRRKRCELRKIEEQQSENEVKFKNCACALFNLKQYKLKLKNKAQIICDDLNAQQQLIEQLNNLQIIETIENETKRTELQTTIKQLFVYNNEQKQLEKLRQQHLEFLFDSEAQQQYEQQNQIWQKEQLARQHLIKTILETIQSQINDNLQRNQQQQKELVNERELLIKNIEQYNNELETLKQQQLQTIKHQHADNAKQIQLKGVHRKLDKNKQLQRVNKELENIRKEEERLKREIINLQRRQGPIRPPRSRILL